ncbi:hypothetical protein [Kitasatospora sp. NPDC058478]|uniref:hypothetical protein n=1 Tax=unclassified Kitasatospora TaxID=2633591 RepID=UPI0036598617
MSAEPFIHDDDDHDACWICPSLRLPVGAFDVLERPNGDYPFNPEDGFRYSREGVPACVHGDRIGLPPGRYASAGEALPEG